MLILVFVICLVVAKLTLITALTKTRKRVISILFSFVKKIGFNAKAANFSKMSSLYHIVLVNEGTAP